MKVAIALATFAGSYNEFSMNAHAYLSIAVSLGLGLLVGLQRQWKEPNIAGIRTFPLITLLGTLSVLLSDRNAGWLTAAGLLAMSALLVLGNLARLQSGKFDAGITTEVAVLLMYCVGAAIGVGLVGPGVVMTGITAVLLHSKAKLHRWISRLGERDLSGIIQLVLIALVILPVLPDETFGPYDVLNPYKIWRMVVLIVGISMTAYVAYLVLGARAGVVLGGIFGGLISSTATTVSYARQTKANHDTSAMAALVIVIASAVVNVRVMVEIGVVAPNLLRFALLPLAIMFAVMAVSCALFFVPLRHQSTSLPDQSNPAQLKPAVIFGGLYAIILFVVAAAKDLFGDQALYAIAMVSGLTDVDALTLSTAKLFNDRRVEATTAWRVILIATMSNLVFKAGAVAALGSRRLFVYVAVMFAIAMATGGVLFAYWPDVEILLQLPVSSSISRQ